MNKIEQEPSGAQLQRGNQMLGSSVKRTIVAISAALTLSAVTIGATISPAQAGTIHVPGAARG
jgi:hypothetical protein